MNIEPPYISKTKENIGPDNEDGKVSTARKATEYEGDGISTAGSTNDCRRIQPQPDCEYSQNPSIW
jgi:hypothetical protein